jgi:hypothetical protein
VLDDPDPMPNDELQAEADFHLANQAYQGRTGCIAVIGLALWMGGGCLTAVGLGVLRTAPPNWLYIPLLGWTMFGWPVLMAVALFVSQHRARQDGRLTCRGCRNLLGRWGGLVVSVSGRCPSCGRRALVDPEPDDLPDDIALPPTAPLLATDEFARRATAQERAAVRGWMIFVLLWLALEAPVLGPFFVLGRFELEWRLTQLLDDAVPASWLIDYGFLPWLALGTLAAIAPGVWWYLRVVRRRPLECPHCHKSFLLPRLVLASRRCDRCLEVAVSDPLGVEPSPPGG